MKYRVFRMMIRHKNEMVSNGTYLYFFEWVFPLLGSIYWTYRGIMGKIKKRAE